MKKVFARGAIAFVVTAMLSSFSAECMAGWRLARWRAAPAACPQLSEESQGGAGFASVPQDPAITEPAPSNREPTLAPPRAASAAARSGAEVYVTVEIASPEK